MAGYRRKNWEAYATNLRLRREKRNDEHDGFSSTRASEYRAMEANVVSRYSRYANEW